LQNDDSAAKPAAMARMRKKADLPSKPCAHCGRPFTWRKKWSRDWENVRYCSDACRRGTPALDKRED
jgi:hypothetical protein